MEYDIANKQGLDNIVEIGCGRNLIKKDAKKGKDFNIVGLESTVAKLKVNDARSVICQYIKL
jgi:uncharacterized hydantoinase/oxoprolinase family protein